MPFHRILTIMFNELTAPDPVLDSQRRPILTTPTSIFPSSGHHALQSQFSTGDDGCPVQMKIAKAQLTYALEQLSANECLVVFKWTSQSQMRDMFT
nr:unnamed protein product [Meloidogyne enterolobii]CAD2197155.1 unnamed protein product [Meloidogyne enterolobii]CAD2205921.1 unnamed protein product [Meloidogyne enterolobii]